jgi:hypothetical protein
LWGGDTVTKPPPGPTDYQMLVIICIGALMIFILGLLWLTV